jgi:hypothetical protein
MPVGIAPFLAGLGLFFEVSHLVAEALSALAPDHAS